MMQGIGANKDKGEAAGVEKNKTETNKVAKYIKDFLMYRLSNELKSEGTESFHESQGAAESFHEPQEATEAFHKPQEATESFHEPQEATKFNLTSSDTFAIMRIKAEVIDESDSIFHLVLPGKKVIGSFDLHLRQEVGGSKPSLDNKNLNLSKKSIKRTSGSKKKVNRRKDFPSHIQYNTTKLKLRNYFKTNSCKREKCLVNSNLIKKKLGETNNNSDILPNSHRMPLAEQNFHATKKFYKNKTFNSQFVEPPYNEKNCSNGKYQNCVVKIEKLPILDRLLPSKKPNPSWDISLCDLCEPKRLFLSKIALKTHIYEQHVKSSFDS